MSRLFEYIGMVLVSTVVIFAMGVAIYMFMQIFLRLLGGML